MKKELIFSYKRIMTNLLNAIVKEHIPYTLTLLERIEDDTSEIRTEFELRKPSRGTPVHWMGILRFLRFSLVLKKELMIHYDDFVAAYQRLASMSSRNEDENQLLKEIGDFLYRVDEYTGDHERLIMKLISELNKGLVEIHGMQLEPGEEIFRSSMTPEVERVIKPMLEELSEICEGMLDQIKIMKALKRVRNLILLDNG